MAKFKPQPTTAGKRVVAPNPPVEESPEQRPPIFCLRYMRKGYCLEDCSEEERAAFASTLYRLSQLTWAEIKTSPRHGMGTEKIDKSSIKGDSTNHLSEDVTLLAIRFSGLKPMVGYRDGAIFHIIWLDYNFTLYKHS